MFGCGSNVRIRQKAARRRSAGAGTTSAEGTPAPGSGTPSVNGAALSLPFGDVSSEENGSQDADELGRESWLAIQQARPSVDRMNMYRTHVGASRPMSNTAFIHPPFLS